MRVIEFTDRFGRLHSVGFLSVETELSCRHAHGTAWADLRKLLVTRAAIQQRSSDIWGAWVAATLESPDAPAPRPPAAAQPGGEGAGAGTQSPSS